MSSFLRDLSWGRWAELGLGATLLAAPLAGGGWRLEVLPVIGAFAAAAFVAAMMDTRRPSRDLPVPPLAAALVLLAGFTALQAVPWSESMVRSLSPMVAEVRAFVVGDPSGPISYEPGATWREAGKLVLYALVVFVVAFRVRTHPGRAISLVAKPTVAAGLAIVFVALVHRALGIERLFGLIDTARAEGGLWTTFINPNHAAGFLNLAGFCAVAVALEAKERPQRVGFAVGAAVLFTVSIAMMSKGALLALGLAGVLLLVMMKVRRSTAVSAWAAGIMATGLTASAAAGTVIIVYAERTTPELNWGLVEKLDAARDALAMIYEHPWWGVGRGAFVSAYARYKTSALQLTFAFPENLVVQLTAEWGLVVGAIAFTGLLVLLIVRWWKVSTPGAMAVLAGVTAVVVQNLADFSLELAGVAVAVVAALTATGGRTQPWRYRLSGGLGPAAVIACAFTALVAAWGLAFSTGDLDSDLKRFKAWTESTERPADEEIEALWRRHPASPTASAYVSYLRETASPPDLPEALRAANRTLFLAPQYADGHLIVGRLLLRAGRRKQAFEALRRAWALSVGRRYLIIERVARWAQTPAELLLAVPRRDEALDVADEVEVMRAVQAVLKLRRCEQWCPQLFAALGPPGAAPRSSWPSVVHNAITARQAEIGLTWVRHWRSEVINPANSLQYARLLMLAGDDPGAMALLGSMPEPNDEGVLTLRFSLALKTERWSEALAVTDLMAARLAPTRGNRARVARMKAKAYTRAGRLQEAVDALSEAVEQSPGDAELRLARARLLLKLRRRQEASADVHYVLRRWPKHAAARSLSERIRRR